MNNNEAQIIEAEFVRNSSKSTQYDCEGDLVWFPKSQVTFDATKKELTVPTWLLKKTFPGEF